MAERLHAITYKTDGAGNWMARLERGNGTVVLAGTRGKQEYFANQLVWVEGLEPIGGPAANGGSPYVKVTDRYGPMDKEAVKSAPESGQTRQLRERVRESLARAKRKDDRTMIIVYDQKDVADGPLCFLVIAKAPDHIRAVFDHFGEIFDMFHGIVESAGGVHGRQGAIPQYCSERFRNMLKAEDIGQRWNWAIVPIEGIPRAPQMEATMMGPAMRLLLEEAALWMAVPSEGKLAAGAERDATGCWPGERMKSAYMGAILKSTDRHGNFKLRPLDPKGRDIPNTRMVILGGTAGRADLFAGKRVPYEITGRGEHVDFGRLVEGVGAVVAKTRDEFAGREPLRAL